MRTKSLNLVLAAVGQLSFAVYSGRAAGWNGRAGLTAVSLPTPSSRGVCNTVSTRTSSTNSNRLSLGLSHGFAAEAFWRAHKGLNKRQAHIAAAKD
jgi:hypothetical protein